MINLKNKGKVIVETRLCVRQTQRILEMEANVKRPASESVFFYSPAIFIVGCFRDPLLFAV